MELLKTVGERAMANSKTPGKPFTVHLYSILPYLLTYKNLDNEMRCKILTVLQRCVLV